MGPQGPRGPKGDPGLGGGNGRAFGSTDKDMADANQTLTSGEAAKAKVRGFGTLTAKRTLTYPTPATEDEAYATSFTHDATGNFPIVISVGVGADSEIPPKKSAIVWISPTGTKILALSSPKHVIDAQEWGVKSDGVLSGAICSGTDDTAALQAMLTAASAPNGYGAVQPAKQIVFPNGGIVKIDGQLSLDYVTRIWIKGPVQLHFTSSAAGALFKLLSSAYITFEDVDITYESATFAHNVVQTGHGVSGSDALEICFVNCRFASTQTAYGNYNAWSHIRFSNAIDCHVSRCDFSLAQRAISGRCNGAVGDPDEEGFANAISIGSCAFHRLMYAAIHNPGEVWHIYGANNFEPRIVAEGVFSSERAIYQDDTTYICFALNASGNWIGDGGGASDGWIQGRFFGCNLSGNLISGNSPDPAIYIRGGSGYHIAGNRISGCNQFSNVNDLTDPGEHLDTSYVAGVSIQGNTIGGSGPYQGEGNIVGAYMRGGNEDASGEGNTFDLPLTVKTSITTLSRFTAKAVTWDPGTVADGAAATSGDIACYGVSMPDALSVGGYYTLAGSATPMPDGVILWAKAVDTHTARVTLLNFSGAGFTPGTMNLTIHGAGVGAVVTPTPFDPLSVGTPVLWLDSTDLTQGGGTVSAIVDKASTSTVTITGGQEPGYTASNANYANAPTFDFVSGTPCVHITGHTITTGAFTVVIVGDGLDGFWMQDANGTSEASAGGGSGNKLQITCDAGTWLASATVAYAVPGVYVMEFAAASSKLYTSAHTADATGNAGTQQDLTGVQITLGNSNAPGGAGTRMGGSVRHWLIYKGALSQPDVEYLLDGFGAESGITIGA